MNIVPHGLQAMYFAKGMLLVPLLQFWQDNPQIEPFGGHFLNVIFIDCFSIQAFDW
jgi:hypothetical protein